MTNKLFVFPIGFAVHCFLTQLAVAQSSSDPVGARFANGIAAIVEEKIITVGDIRREIESLLPQIRSQSRTAAEFSQNLEEVEDDIIQNLTDQILIVKDFHSEKKRRIPSSIVENEIKERIITQFEGDRSKFLEYLRAIGKTPREFRILVRDEIIVSYMRGQLRKSQSIVSPVKIEKFYAENQERFYQGDSVHLRLIRLAQLADENEAVLAQTADNIIGQLKEGASFEDLATQYSQDTRKKQGGDWGWINREDLKPELADVAFSLGENKFSEPIRTGNDIFILYVEEKRQAGVQPLAEVRNQIERHLISQMARDATERYLERLRRDGYVRYFN
jgi:peptidyl-prolyl cis-trans isomerase SurA